MNNYFDNSATSFPKPIHVSTEISRYLNDIGGPYGRSSYSKAIQTARIVEQTRELIAEKLNTAQISSVVFSLNATYAINTIIHSFDKRNSHILVSPLEHNAVIRPLQNSSNIQYSVLPSDASGRIDVSKIKECIKDNTSLVIVNHVSNVNGVIQPLEEIKKEIGDIPLLVDGAQSFGHIPVFIDTWNIDYFAFTGHKGLLGPTGTGGFFIKNPESISPFVYGGTGSNSESYDQPLFMPDKFEAGTLNIAGIFGLFGSLHNYPQAEHEKKDFIFLLERIKKLENIRLYCALENEFQAEIFSFSHTKKECSEVYSLLYNKFEIEARIGLHCAPLAHRTLGTYPEGTIRISPSVYHNKSDFERLFSAIEHINIL